MPKMASARHFYSRETADICSDYSEMEKELKIARDTRKNRINQFISEFTANLLFVLQAFKKEGYVVFA